MKKHWIMLLIFLFISPVLWRILLDEGEKWEIKTPKTLDKK